MPVQTSFPGVYVQEVPSGVRTIVGVSTSVTAFVGQTRQGPVNTPVAVRSMAEYVRTFGLPWDEARPMGHAVQLFFVNGGAQALVVRVVGTVPDGAQVKPAPAATANLVHTTGTPPPPVLTLTARGAGVWANKAGGQGMEAAVAYGTAENPADLFGVTIRLRGRDPRTGESALLTEETFGNLSMASAHLRYAPTVLAGSTLVTATVAANAPTTTDQATSTGGDVGTGDVTIGTTTGTLRVAVDYGPPVDLVISTKSPAAATSKADIRKGINDAAAAAGVPITAAGGNTNFLLTTTGTAGPNRSVVVLVAPQNDASQVLKLGRTWGGAEVSGAAKARPAETLAPAGFTGGSDGTFSADSVVPTSGDGGIYALGSLEFPRFNLLCLPDLPASNLADTATLVNNQKLTEALAYCVRERAFLIVDTPKVWPVAPAPNLGGLPALGEHGAIYYPRVTVVEPGPGGLPLTLSLPACGAVAGVMARTDASRGVWKAPAGLADGGIAGIAGLSAGTDDNLSGVLNPRGVNVLRTFPGAGAVIWGARTIKGADTQSSDYKYVPVRRLTSFIAGSLYLGTQFAVFEGNDPDLWGQLRLAVTTFMRTLFDQGAFQQGPSRAESDSFFVTCDESVNPQSEIDLGRVNVVVGFAPLKPAEFVIISITHISNLEA
ncbi:phage tail sheath subtilisin-like domain-containing protein [Actinomadura sp. 6N118]|uniref:phage tail sheath subtilisin-like domain-containing protein n=1 Tax=Actinomadura sp. 6N118 TaxID=3375151 RepID=UPI0037B54AA1